MPEVVLLYVYYAQTHRETRGQHVMFTPEGMVATSTYNSGLDGPSTYVCTYTLSSIYYFSLHRLRCSARWKQYTVALRLRRSDEGYSGKYGSLYAYIARFSPRICHLHQDDLVHPDGTATLLNITKWIERTASNQVCTPKTILRSK